MVLHIGLQQAHGARDAGVWWHYDARNAHILGNAVGHHWPAAAKGKKGAPDETDHELEGLMSEIESDLREEEFKKIWKRHGNSIIAAAVALELSRRGVSRVAVLAGGYVEWVRAGGSLSHDAP